MKVAIDEVVYFDAITSNPTTGAVADADSTPTFDVYEEATDTGLLGATNLTKRTSLTGDYRGTFTASAANGFEAGKWYSVVVSATVATVAGKAVTMHFQCVPAESVAGVPKVDLADWLGVAPLALTSQRVETVVGAYASGQGPLQPTVAGRTLDVSAGGEAGVDWANVGSPTTVVGLSGTTVKTATDVETDTQDIQARLPAALTGDGLMKADTLRVGGTLQSAADIEDHLDFIQSILDNTVNTNFETIKNRLGSITGSGNNTVLGFFKAALNKAAATPSDIGGTFNPATDSTEAIRDRGDAAWGSAGASTNEPDGLVGRSGSTYAYLVWLKSQGVIVTGAGLTACTVTIRTAAGDLVLSGSASINTTTGLISGSGTLTTALPHNTPAVAYVTITSSGTDYTAPIGIVALA